MKITGQQHRMLAGWLLVALVVWVVGARQAVAATVRFNDLEDAAVSQAREWQKGGKARAVMSSDGKVVFPFGQTMPKLTCSPTRACDVEMQPAEKVKKVVLGDGVNWTWSPAESVEHGVVVQHVIFQPHDSDLESNVIILTDHRTYHMKLFAPKTGGAYINRAAFYYPQELVQDWEEKETTVVAVADKVEAEKVMATPVSIEKIDLNYTVSGSASFKPVNVFNDGERTFMEMPDSLRVSGSPTLLLLDEKNEVMKVNYRREEDPKTGVIHYVVDKLFTQAELRLGDEKVKIMWKKKKGKGF